MNPVGLPTESLLTENSPAEVEACLGLIREEEFEPQMTQTDADKK
jgi:hypothetical protein